MTNSYIKMFCVALLSVHLLIGCNEADLSTEANLSTENIIASNTIDDKCIETDAIVEKNKPIMETSLSEEAISQQKAADFIGKNLGELKAEYGTPLEADAPQINDTGGYTWSYRYEKLYFEYSNYGLTYDVADDTLVFAALAIDNAYITENIKAGMTYSELADYIDFSSVAPEYYEYENGVVAFGSIIINDYDCSVEVGFANNAENNVNAESRSIYIFCSDVLESDIDRKKAEAFNAKAQDETFNGKVKINTGFLNMRTSPNGEIINKLEDDTSVIIEDYCYCDTDVWLYVYAPSIDQRGYVSAAYISSPCTDFMYKAMSVTNDNGYCNTMAFFDIDKNGTSEFIIKKGQFKTNCVYEIYTSKNGRGEYLGSISAVNAVLYKSNNGSLVIQVAFMGGECVSSIDIINDEIIQTELYSNYMVQEYSNPGKTIEIDLDDICR